MRAEWPGVLDPDVLNPRDVDEIDRLADAAKAGHWPTVLALLDGSPRLSAHQWRPGGRSWFTPLHQAAWLGASADVVERLLEHGGWPSLRDAEGRRPIDLAQRRGHRHLADVLALRQPSERDQQILAAWDRHLAALIATRTRGIKPVRIRQVPTEVLAAEPLDTLWFGYPGMYGGFRLSNRTDSLQVDSWSRVVGGSGQRHVITEESCVLVDEGFV